MEGALRTTPSMVRESNFGKEGLITVGRAGAAAYFTLHFLLLALDPQTGELDGDAPAVETAVLDTTRSLYLAVLKRGAGDKEDRD